jgi:hypothetical protein
MPLSLERMSRTRRRAKPRGRVTGLPHDRSSPSSMLIARGPAQPRSWATLPGNTALVRAARAEAARGGRRYRALHRTGGLRLSARGPGAEARPCRRACRAAIEELGGARRRTAGRRCWSPAHGPRKASCYNAVLLLADGAIQARRFKVDLPNYGVFDEKRVFAPGPAAGAGRVQAACGSACRSARTSGRDDVVECLAETGAEILLVPNGSPYERRQDRRPALNLAVAIGSRKAACRWSMSTRSAARTNWCSTAPPSC